MEANTNLLFYEYIIIHCTENKNKVYFIIKIIKVSKIIALNNSIAAYKHRYNTFLNNYFERLNICTNNVKICNS